MSVFQFVASLVASLAWPVAIVAAVFILRTHLAAAVSRVRKIEALGVTAELDAVEQAREVVEQELANPERNLDELVERAAELGWHLGRAVPDVRPGVHIDRSSDTPVIHSASEEILRRYAARKELKENLFAWRRIADQLEKLITSGQFEVGQPFPTDKEISKAYSVGVDTARSAINELRRRHLVIRVIGKGDFVAPKMPEFAMPPGPPESTEEPHGVNMTRTTQSDGPPESNSAPTD